MVVAELGQEQMTDAGQDQVPRDRPEVANFKVIQPQFGLAVLEQSFNPPAA